MGKGARQQTGWSILWALIKPWGDKREAADEVTEKRPDPEDGKVLCSYAASKALAGGGGGQQRNPLPPIQALRSPGRWGRGTLTVCYA